METGIFSGGASLRYPPELSRIFSCGSKSLWGDGSDPKSWYCIILTICSNNKRIHGGIAPSLRDKEDDWGWFPWTCHVKLLDQWRRRSAQSQNSIGEWSQSAGETRWKSGLLISTDWNVSLSPAPSGNRSRILSLLFLIAKEHFRGRGFKQWTRWTRSRIHGGGTNRTPSSSFAGLTRWVSFSVGSVLDLLVKDAESVLKCCSTAAKCGEIRSVVCWRVGWAADPAGRRPADWISPCGDYARTLASVWSLVSVGDSRLLFTLYRTQGDKVLFWGVNRWTRFKL